MWHMIWGDKSCFTHLWRIWAEQNFGPGALTSEMGRMQLVLSLQRQLKSVPFAEGVNNHMGSALTQNSTAMHWFYGGVGSIRYFSLTAERSPKPWPQKLPARGMAFPPRSGMFFWIMTCQRRPLKASLSA